VIGGARKGGAFRASTARRAADKVGGKALRRPEKRKLFLRRGRRGEEQRVSSVDRPEKGKEVARYDHSAVPEEKKIDTHQF